MIMVTSWSSDENHCFLMRRASSGYWLPGTRTRALEIAEGGTAARIHDPLDRGVRVFGRVMDLRDVMHRRDTAVELAERTEQLADVDVLRPVHRGERLQNVLEVIDDATRRAIGQEDPVREKAPQRRLELVMVRIDEAGHDDAAAGVDHRGVARLQLRSDGEDLLALDQHVGLGEVADLRIHRHHGTAANDVAPAPLTEAFGRRAAVRGGRASREQIETGDDAGRGRRLQEIAPRTGMILRNSFRCETCCEAHATPCSCWPVTRMTKIGCVTRTSSTTSRLASGT